MGWDNPPVPWREFERRLSWGTGADGKPGAGQDTGQPGSRGAPGRPATGLPVTRLPVEQDAPAWAELHCHSSYSFLDGASSPSDLVHEAVARGLSALAITDHDGMYGVPQFAQAAARLRDSGAVLATVFGAELSLDLVRKVPGRRARPPSRSGLAGTGGSALGGGGLPGRSSLAGNSSPGPARMAGMPGRAGTPRAGVPDPAGRHLLILARDPEGYARLCRVISAAQLAGGEKGLPIYDEAALAGAHDGHWVILTGCRKGAVPAALTAHGPAVAARELARLTAAFGADNVKVELTIGNDPADDERNDVLAALAAAAGVDVIATGNVHYAAPQDARLAQALAAIRAKFSLDEMDGWLAASGGGYLRSGREMAGRLRRYPGVLERTAELAADCAFDFHVIAPKLPDFQVPGDHTEASWLRELVRQKAPGRYGPLADERTPAPTRRSPASLMSSSSSVSPATS